MHLYGHEDQVKAFRTRFTELIPILIFIKHHSSHSYLCNCICICILGVCSLSWPLPTDCAIPLSLFLASSERAISSRMLVSDTSLNVTTDASSSSQHLLRHFFHISYWLMSCYGTGGKERERQTSAVHVRTATLPPAWPPTKLNIKIS